MTKENPKDPRSEMIEHADTLGWSDTSKVDILLAFIEQEPETHARFAAFLQERHDQENGYDSENVECIGCENRFRKELLTRSDTGGLLCIECLARNGA